LASLELEIPYIGKLFDGLMLVCFVFSTFRHLRKGVIMFFLYYGCECVLYTL